MGRLIRAMDWSTTPLGRIESWPQSLRTTVSVCLSSNFPIDIVWGKEHVQIYNDGYWPICGAKHPVSMGQDYRECWASAWPFLTETFAKALSGDAQFFENFRLMLNRNGFQEETYFTFSYSPIRDESGGVGGVFHLVTETTVRMLSERRVRALRDLAAHAGEAQTIEEACALIIRTLADYASDLPFVLLYLVDETRTRVRLASAAGLEPGTAVSPIEADLCALGDSSWPLECVVARGHPMEVNDLERRFGALRCGPYPEPPRAAFVHPIQPSGLEYPLGLLVTGVSARLPLNEAYRDFYAMLARAVTAALSEARARTRKSAGGPMRSRRSIA